MKKKNKTTFPPMKFMVESGIILRDSLLLAESLVKPGTTTLYINDMVHRYIVSNGAEPAFLGYCGFPATCCISVNEEVVHCIPSDRQLVEGDIVSIDCGVLKNGAYTDAARTFPVGTISEEDAKLIAITKEALNRGIEKVIPGYRVGIISNIIQETAELNGFSVSREFIGHGIGTELHMSPDVPNYGSRKSGPVLKVGSFIAVEPVIFFGGWKTKSLGPWNVVSVNGNKSAHFENTIYIGELGPIILTE